MRSLFWEEKKCSRKLHKALIEVSLDGYIKKGKCDGIEMVFSKSEKPGKYKIIWDKDTARIKYGDIPSAMRAVSTLLSGVAKENIPYTEVNPFSTLGIMIDCSRNAVMKVSHVKKWLRKLALLGYNTTMLYTEDTYELPGEEYFGYMRGKYTIAELKEIDDYANIFGIEMIGCIQTLGHLKQVLKWTKFRNVMDTEDILLVDSNETYALIDKMIEVFSKNFRSRRLHIGMDEADNLGRGFYLDKNGYHEQFDIFTRHIDMVTKLCKKHNVKPMIWSDMYFRMGSKTHSYYDKECVIPSSVVSKIPKDVSLVYWDYYHSDASFYKDWIHKHKKLGSAPIMVSGLLTWNVLWYYHEYSKPSVSACIDACTETKLDELIFALWGDDGAFCDFDSVWAGLVFTAEKVYSGKENIENIRKRFSSIFKAHYDTHVRAGSFDKKMEIYHSSALLWDDPILGIFWNEQLSLHGKNYWEKTEKHYVEQTVFLKKHIKEKGNAGNLKHAYLLSNLLASKIKLRDTLLSFYQKPDQKISGKLQAELKNTKDALEKVSKSFREIWMERNKPFGFEVIQIRLAGLSARLEELRIRINEFMKNKVSSIPELEEIPSEACGYLFPMYSTKASGSSIL